MNLNQKDWQEKLQSSINATIIDVRTPQECSTGIISNAVTIDIYDTKNFIVEIEKLDRFTPYFVYCRSGVRSAQACEVMHQMGFTQTFNLVGGVLEWTGGLV